MKSVVILNKVYVVGDTYKLTGMFINPGKVVTLRPVTSIRIECKALEVDASGTLCEIIDIISEDELATMMVEAEDVEVETTNYDDEDTRIRVKQSDTKKNIVALLESYDYKVDTSKTKKQILEEFERARIIEVI